MGESTHTATECKAENKRLSVGNTSPMGRENLARAPPPPKRYSKSSEAAPQSAGSGAPDWIRSYDDDDGRVDLNTRQLQGEAAVWDGGVESG
jgi:hypothetical protein